MSLTRRRFFGTAVASAGLAVGTPLADPIPATAEPIPAAKTPADATVSVSCTVNGKSQTLAVDPRVTLLDTLRERLGLTGTKKGCDRGQCGACTVHVDGRRVLSCLTLAATVNGRQVTTVEGLATGDTLNPVQQAFIDNDGMQCGFCTSGQVMSAVALIREGHAGSGDEIREWMSGNICRCGCYSNIVDAVTQASTSGKAV
ncbi:MAG TPA: (2Fe-2S)-binding protein [Pseudonocardiaceae bacterium]|jgi:xanthine dehydrogenase YagT iron-sulfur-binding subunit|nr:(2Fe-2S)-binding protein [Pseudonocardiaceae bacterium]